MSEDTLLPFGFLSVGRKKVTVAFDGGRITSDSGVLLLTAAERRLGIAGILGGLIADSRNPLDCSLRHTCLSVAEFKCWQRCACAERPLQAVPETERKVEKRWSAVG